METRDVDTQRLLQHLHDISNDGTTTYRRTMGRLTDLDDLLVYLEESVVENANDDKEKMKHTSFAKRLCQDMGDIWDRLFSVPSTRCDITAPLLDVGTQRLPQHVHDNVYDDVKIYDLLMTTLPGLDELEDIGVLEERITKDKHDKEELLQTALRLRQEGWVLQWDIDTLYAGSRKATPYLYPPCIEGEGIFDDILCDLHAEYDSFPRQ
jgi:hypothetical protein